MNTKSQNKSKNKLKNKLKFNKTTIYYLIFILIWTALTTIAGQYLSAQLLVLFLGTRISEPFWTLVYYVVSYAITLSLLILIPPQFLKLWHKNHPSAASTESDSTDTAAELSQDLSATATDLGLQKLPTFIDIGLAPVGYIVYLFFANLLTSFMQIFPWFEIDQAQDVGFSYYGSGKIFAMLAIVFVAPIAEEIIMRGWLYGKVRHKVKNIPLAIILVSLLFAILHGQWNVGVTVFVLSAILCTLREVTGTIWSGMLLHILSNGIAFYILYIGF